MGLPLDARSAKKAPRNNAAAPLSAVSDARCLRYPVRSDKERRARTEFPRLPLLRPDRLLHLFAPTEFPRTLATVTFSPTSGSGIGDSPVQVTRHTPVPPCAYVVDVPGPVDSRIRVSVGAGAAPSADGALLVSCGGQPSGRDAAIAVRSLWEALLRENESPLRGIVVRWKAPESPRSNPVSR